MKTERRTYTTQVREALERFVRSDDFPETFLLTGRWGVGKTHLVRSVLDSKGTRHLARPRQAWCSLFGADCLNAVRDKLYESLVIEGAATARKWSPSSLLDRIHTGGPTSKAKEWGAPILKAFPAMASSESLVRMMTFRSVRDAIIVLDDLERRSESLPLREVFGLVAQLREDRNCKVIVIANEDTLEPLDKGALSKLREKVFDLVVNFDPPPEYAIEIALPPEIPFRAQWVEDVRKLELTNIRILSRIVGLVRQLDTHVASAPGTTHEQIVHAILLFGAHFFENRETFPALDFIIDPPSRFGKKDEESKTWQEFLKKYGWLYTDELDLELLHFVRTGCFDSDAIATCVSAAIKLHADHQAEQALRRGWDLYHQSLGDDGIEIVRLMREAHLTYPQHVTPVNLDGAVRIVREIGDGAGADEMIARYVDAHRANPEMLDLSEYRYRGDVKDPSLRARFGEAVGRKEEVKELGEVLPRIAKEHGWGPSDLAFLASVPPERFREFFEALKGPDLHECIEVPLRFGRFVNADDIGRRIEANALEALRAIAAKSPLNALRLARHNIQPGGETTE